MISALGKKGGKGQESKANPRPHETVSNNQQAILTSQALLGEAQQQKGKADSECLTKLPLRLAVLWDLGPPKARAGTRVSTFETVPSCGMSAYLADGKRMSSLPEDCLQDGSGIQHGS